MAASATTVDDKEIAQFDRIAPDWWDPSGMFKPLHQMNPLRVGYIRDRVVAHFGQDEASVTPFDGLRIVDVGCGGGLLSEPESPLLATKFIVPYLRHKHSQISGANFFQHAEVLILYD